MTVEQFIALVVVFLVGCYFGAQFMFNVFTVAVTAWIRRAVEEENNKGHDA